MTARSDDPPDPGRAEAYARWLGEVREGGDPDGYYSDPRRRFELAPEDVLLRPGDLRVEPADCGVRLASATTGASVAVCGLSPAEALRALDAIDGRRTAEEVRSAAAVMFHREPLQWRGCRHLAVSAAEPASRNIPVHQASLIPRAFALCAHPKAVSHVHDRLSASL